VLECGDTLAAAYAGRLLCDLGAAVVKIEGPAGDPMRALAPFCGGIPHRDMSAPFAYFNAGKKSASPRHNLRAALRTLCIDADVVIRSARSDRAEPDDRLLEEVIRDNPGIIVVDISTFGRSSARSPHGLSDLLALAAGGLLSINSSSPTDPEAAPLRYRGEMASVHAACDAVVAVLGSLFERARSGLGQRIDISAQAAVASILATGLARYSYQGQVPVRNGTRAVAPWGFYRCADGLVLIQCTEDEEWRRLLDILGNPDWGDLEVFATTAQRELVADVLDTFLGEALASRPLAEFMADTYRHRVPAAPIHSAADIVSWGHLQERHFLQPVVVSDGRRRIELRVPGPAWRYHGTPWAGRGPAPRLGEHHWADGWDSARPRSKERPPADPDAQQSESDGRGRPLAGVRVIDLTWVWAGPYGTMQLAHLGAEVIKIESARRVDVTRRLGPYADDVTGINRSGYFNQYNQGKKSVTLNLKDGRAVRLLEALIATADVVVDNMRSGALAQLGLDYAHLRSLNPRIVAVSMTGFGETGSEHDRVAYGSLIDALSGAAAANGLVGGGPTDFPMSLPDPAAGIHMAIATLAALYRARTTGVGERVECSMLESCLAAFPWPVLYQSAIGCEAPVLGNRDEQRSPHDVFRTADNEKWIALAVDNDRQFAALAGVIGHPDLATDPRFATLEGRRLHEDDLDRVLTEWVASVKPAEAIEHLNAAGVPAEPVATVDELFDSEDLGKRGFFLAHDHPEVGRRKLAGVAWTTDRTPMSTMTAAPTLGQHTREVLADLLGLSSQEIEVLEQEGVVA
jgi:crotonobetainyl-CoA:carnitine CoA-transferase CaiB-like acyl-CoA transferase